MNKIIDTKLINGVYKPTGEIEIEKEEISKEEIKEIIKPTKGIRVIKKDSDPVGEFLDGMEHTQEYLYRFEKVLQKLMRGVR